MSNLEISAEILSNMADESHAQSGYCGLIYNMLLAGCPDTDIDIIREIQSDERNHTLKLFNLAQKYNAIKTTNDDKEKILEDIEKGFAE